MRRQAATAITLLLAATSVWAFSRGGGAGGADGVAGSGPGTGRPVARTFERYVPSAWERDWDAHVRGGNSLTDVCARLGLPEEQQRADAFLARAAAIRAGKLPLRAADDAEDPLLSKMVYRTPHGLEARYVEPLVGGLRHPHVCRSFPEAWNREFLLPERRGDPREPAPRSLFFDLGAGAWAEGIGGASPSFFHAVYRRGGLGFARMFLWEATRTDPVAFFRGVPEDMRPRVQFYNVPVEKESNGLFSVFNAVLAEAAPEDHVVLKVDIDSPGLEDEIVAHLASTPKLAALVDEVYYEHHADWMPMAKTWSCHVVKCPPLRASYDVFGQLRRLGIRAHSWT